MKLSSLILNNNRLEIAEVEIELIPGIPQIHFLGLPDRLIKESFYRIKSALKYAGYKFPLTSQVIVNIKPSHLRKSSRGVEFAVALGILIKTEQINEDLIDKNWIVYGELGLNGEVFEPSDLANEVMNYRSRIFLTGAQTPEKKSQAQNIFRVQDLKNFEVNRQTGENQKIQMQRPTFGFYQKYSTEEAEFIFLASTTKLHSLLAGDSGAGKSTLAKAIPSFAKEPQAEENVRLENDWRPVVNPHQSISPAAFIGGGAYLHEGEIERAQGGFLVLDEMLEFDSDILETLRGPMTGDDLRLARGAYHRYVTSNFQVIATSNLCPCGKWTPQKTNLSCRFSRQKCRRYLERLSGPLLDRFGLLFFVQQRPDRKIESFDILQRIQLIEKFLARAQFATENPLIEQCYQNLSVRRKKYLDRVAQIYALEREILARKNEVLPDKLSVYLQLQDYSKAEKWVIKPFEQLEKGMS